MATATIEKNSSGGFHHAIAIGHGVLAGAAFEKNSSGGFGHAIAIGHGVLAVAAFEKNRSGGGEGGGNFWCSVFCMFAPDSLC
jgi:hypothetical protein